MNGIRCRLSSQLHSHGFLLPLFSRIVNATGAVNSRHCTADASNGPGNSESYIPRRIKRRIKEKNLNIEDFEIAPVYNSDCHKRRSLNSLDDTIVDIESEAEFPSDIKATNTVRPAKEILPKEPRPKVDPRETSILLFPGQGSQFVGMGKKVLPYPGVTELYEKASAILGYDLLNICLNGPEKELNKTVHCQPAVFVTSLAAVERLKEDVPEAHETCKTAAGFSLGEITALVYSGAISFEDGLKLVKARAQLMQNASENIPSGMLTVFCDHKTELKKALRFAREYCIKELKMENPICSIANYLCTDAKVIAGHEETLQFLQQYGKEFGIRSTKRLPVSGAFHTRLMKADGSIREVEKLIRKIKISKPSVKVYSNLTAKWYIDDASVRRALSKQIYNPIMWEQLIHKVYSRSPGVGFPKTYEVGPSNQLGILLKRTNLRAYEHYNPVSV